MSRQILSNLLTDISYERIALVNTTRVDKQEEKSVYALVNWLIDWSPGMMKA